MRHLGTASTYTQSHYKDVYTKVPTKALRIRIRSPTRLHSYILPVLKLLFKLSNVESLLPVAPCSLSYGLLDLQSKAQPNSGGIGGVAGRESPPVTRHIIQQVCRCYDIHLYSLGGGPAVVMGRICSHHGGGGGGGGSEALWVCITGDLQWCIMHLECVIAEFLVCLCVWWSSLACGDLCGGFYSPFP